MFTALLVVCQLGVAAGPETCANMVPIAKPFLEEKQCEGALKIMFKSDIPAVLDEQGLYVAIARCVDLIGVPV